jgi:hypothetical protein
MDAFNIDASCSAQTVGMNMIEGSLRRRRRYRRIRGSTARGFEFTFIDGGNKKTITTV